MNRKIESQVEEKLEGYLGLDDIKIMFYTICHTSADHQYICKCFHRRIVIFGEITIRGDHLELGREVISQGQQSGCRFVWQWSLAED